MPAAKKTAAKKKASAAKRPVGRPSVYTPEIGDEICRRISGGETLRSICASDHMPDKSTILLWVVDLKHEEFSNQYMIAREAAGYSCADRVLEMSDKARLQQIDPQSARVAMIGYQWAAERMAPKRHSPRQEHTGAEGAPLNVVIAKDDADL